jgi:hypothetical protein
MIDTLPPRFAFAHADVACTVTPVGGAPYATTVRIVPARQGDTVIEGPEFWFWRSEAPGVGPNTVVDIAAGDNAGRWRLIRAVPSESRLTKMVATRG